MKVTFSPLHPAPALKFAANICVVSKQEFDEVARQHKLPYETAYRPIVSPASVVSTHELKDLGQQVRLQPQGITRDAADCPILTIHNSSRLNKQPPNHARTSVFHLLPTKYRHIRNQAQLEESLLTDLKALRQRGKTPHPFLCGGCDFSPPKDCKNNFGFTDYTRRESRKLQRKLLTFLQEAGIPTEQVSQLWGRRSFAVRGGTSVIALPQENTILVHVEHLEDNKDVLDLKTLQRTVSIHIAPRDRLVIGNQTIKGRRGGKLNIEERAARRNIIN